MQLGNIFERMYFNIFQKDIIEKYYNTQFSLNRYFPLYKAVEADNFYTRLVGYINRHSKNAIVLDIGCGLGRMTLECAKHGAKKAIGIDINTYCVREAIEISEHKKNHIVNYIRQGNAEFVRGNAENLPFPDAYADLVILVNVIDRVHNPKRAVDEAYRVLKRHGILLFADPYDWDSRYTPRDKRVTDSSELFDSKKFIIQKKTTQKFIVPVYNRMALEYLDEVLVLQKN